MIKESSTIYKMPYFNIATQSLKYVGKLQTDYQEVICICSEVGCSNAQEGFKYSFSYKCSPTIEPVSYKLKGYTWQANLSYDDIGVDISSNVSIEVTNKINDIISLYPNSLPNDIFSHLQNQSTNWKLSNNIFWRNSNFLYRHEVYDALGYLDTLIPSITISSNIYTVNIKYSFIEQT